MIQQILIGILFAISLFYVGRLIYHSFHAKAGCASGCAKCSAVDFKKIEKQLQMKGK